MNRVIIYSEDKEFLDELNANLINNENIAQLHYSNNIEGLMDELREFKFVIAIIDSNTNNEKIYNLLVEFPIENIVYLYKDEKPNMKHNDKIIFKEKNTQNVEELVKYDVFSKEDSFLIKYIKSKILREVIQLKFEVTNVGVAYLTDSILLAKGNDLLYNLEKDIYPLLAKKYNTTKDKIRWSVNNAVNIMYKNNSLAELKMYFGYAYDRSPTPKMIIYAIINKI